MSCSKSRSYVAPGRDTNMNVIFYRLAMPHATQPPHLPRSFRDRFTVEVKKFTNFTLMTTFEKLVLKCRRNSMAQHDIKKTMT